MGKTGLDRMLVGNFGDGKPVGQGITRKTVFRLGRTQVRLTRSEVNWTPDQKMIELIANGKRFAWRVCSECAKYDRWSKKCEVLGDKTTGGSGCDCWLDISY